MEVCTPGHSFEGKSRTSDVLIDENVRFRDLLLSSQLLKGLKKAGFERPSPIQLKAIPLGRCGLDLIVQAKSGTGKTCVFAVIAIESILAMLDSPSVQILVLAPTREIAVQIWEVLSSIGQDLDGLRCYTFIGGLPITEDRKKLKKCHIAIGTPGRVKQLIEEGSLNTNSLRLFILDEADKLLEQGFQDDINWIYSTLPDNKQMLALSATYPESLAQSLSSYMRNPTFVRLNSSDPSLLGIRQYFKVVKFSPLPQQAFEEKIKHLTQLLSSITFNQCLVFSNYQMRAQNLSEILNCKGWPTTCISGSQKQEMRLNAMAKLKKFQCRVLISTDLTSRGIDAENVNLVVNLDLPMEHETYLHRIGRAGRFGAYGAAITLVSMGKEVETLHTFENKCNTSIQPLPDPIPSDLAKSSGYVSLGHLVSTEQLITRPEEHIDKTYFDSSGVSNSLEMFVNNGSICTSNGEREALLAHAINENGTDTEEKLGDIEGQFELIESELFDKASPDSVGGLCNGFTNGVVVNGFHGNGHMTKPDSKLNGHHILVEGEGQPVHHGVSKDLDTNGDEYSSLENGIAGLSINHNHSNEKVPSNKQNCHRDYNSGKEEHPTWLPGVPSLLQLKQKSTTSRECLRDADIVQNVKQMIETIDKKCHLQKMLDSRYVPPEKLDLSVPRTYSINAPRSEHSSHENSNDFLEVHAATICNGLSEKHKMPFREPPLGENPAEPTPREASNGTGDKEPRYPVRSLSYYIDLCKQSALASKEAALGGALVTGQESAMASSTALSSEVQDTTEGRSLIQKLKAISDSSSDTSYTGDSDTDSDLESDFLTSEYSEICDQFKYQRHLGGSKLFRNCASGSMPSSSHQAYGAFGANIPPVNTQPNHWSQAQTNPWHAYGTAGSHFDSQWYYSYYYQQQMHYYYNNYLHHQHMAHYYRSAMEEAQRQEQLSDAFTAQKEYVAEMSKIYSKYQ